jgi:type III restriction enzyme
MQEQTMEYGEKSIQSTVSYDLLGSIAEQTQLTRKTVASILAKMELPVFNQFKANPEAFIARASTLIKEQKATMVIEHLAYDPIEGNYDAEIRAVAKTPLDFSKAFKAKNHIYDYVFTDSKVEREFAEELDASTEVKVYAKLPKGFAIPTPVGDYNPDWAVAFDAGKVRHIYFIAETKGSMSSLELREIETARINCAKKFFAKITSNEVKYDVVSSYEKLMELVK